MLEVKQKCYNNDCSFWWDCIFFCFVIKDKNRVKDFKCIWEFAKDLRIRVQYECSFNESKQ